MKKYYNQKEYEEIMKRLPKVRKSKNKKLFFKWYTLYLKTEHWQGLRVEVIKRAKGICEECRADQIKDVHHLTYKNVGNENLEDLKGMCDYCHQNRHGKRSKSPAKFGSVLCGELNRLLN